MMTVWSQPDSRTTGGVVRVRSTASAALNHALMVIIPFVLINPWSSLHIHHKHTFLLLLFASSNNRRFPHKTLAHTILPSISYFYFRFVVHSLCLRSACNTLSSCFAGLHRFKTHIHSGRGKDTPPILTDAIFVQSDFPFFGFPLFPSFLSFLSHTGSLRPVDKFPRVPRVSSRLLIFLFPTSSWWETQTLPS